MSKDSYSTLEEYAKRHNRARAEAGHREHLAMMREQAERHRLASQGIMPPPWVVAAAIVLAVLLAFLSPHH